MQVYKEIPVITNQARQRTAEMVGIVSVEEEWTVACHRERVQEAVGSLPEEQPFVLDAGTGMYLNFIVLKIPLAPKVPREIRAEAERLVAEAENARRETREKELALAGTPERGSIWVGELRYDSSFLYLRPPKGELDRNIKVRSESIVRDSKREVRRLIDSGVVPNRSVREAIGVKEMLLYASSKLSQEQAIESISSRTRRLARRQIRWFDKLSRSLPEETDVLVAEKPSEMRYMHLMHDNIWA